MSPSLLAGTTVCHDVTHWNGRVLTSILELSMSTSMYGSLIMIYAQKTSICCYFESFETSIYTLGYQCFNNSIFSAKMYYQKNQFLSNDLLEEPSCCVLTTGG